LGYRLHYRRVPLVRPTGGLADTVIDTNLRSAIHRTATGFVFEEPTPETLRAPMHRPLHYYQRPTRWWHALMVAGVTPAAQTNISPSIQR
jgi:starch synthase